MPRNEAVENLHSAYNLLAPDKASQEALVKARHDMERASLSPQAICRMIAASIYDGLAYGNWLK